jgi:hypothetical protein
MQTITLIPDRTKVKFEIPEEFIGKTVTFTIHLVEDNKKRLSM